MDPVSQIDSQDKIEKMGYKTLGWYHSHPKFKTTPSQIDQTTHLDHQHHYKDQPYIGVIVGPYPTDKSGSRTKGDMFVFHVNANQTYKLNFQMEPMAFLSATDWEELVIHFFHSKINRKAWLRGKESQKSQWI